MDDDGASSVTGRSVAEDDEDIAAQQSQEVPIASSTVPTGDSLYQALRSPSPETVPVASTSAQPAEQQDLITLADPITESSGELTRLMARYPMIITGPGSAPHKVVRTMSHESFMSNLHRASISPSEVLRQESEMASSSGGKGKSVARSGSDQAGLPSSTSKYSDEGNPAPAEFSEESVRKGGSTSIASIASTQRKLSPPSRTPTETPSLVASPSDSTASPSRPRRPDDSGWNFAEPALSTPERLSRDSTVSPRNAKLSVSLAPVPSTSYSSVSTSLYAELQAAEVRNEREREALEREMKQARMEADDLERQCEELSQMLQSLGLQPSQGTVQKPTNISPSRFPAQTGSRTTDAVRFLPSN
ncbi:hypothetical protein CALVIDRAFT_597952 [Calocera viscosa TUFC12733]|uniref:Uncharacterized protein n=1 Tax=Calocera viscosa (strain TUFC12733) TaxID=1330018 RepID=A0A167MKC5_CALVF|nr:hypothetical protein CALVIDRAFT_597952 [Calocera viscosa TUFC12733]